MIMYRIRGLSRFKWLVWGSLLPLEKSHDVVQKDSPIVLDSEDTSNVTGFERLRLMFSLTEYGAIGPELHMSLQSAFTGLIIGASYGGFMWSRKAYMDFLEQNQAASFKSHFEAKKILQDYVTVNFAKGAFIWGWRVALFAGSLVLISTSISVYRGKSGILEYAVAGGVSGSLFRMHLGLRGIIVGGVLGSALGTIGGCLAYTFLKVSGVSMEEIRSMQYKWKEKNTERQARRLKRLVDQDDPPLIKYRESKDSTLTPGFLPDTPVDK